MAEHPTALQPERGSTAREYSGWMLKKAKDRTWARAHHSHRYFVSRGSALSYYERKADSLQSAGLRGVIDLREVRSVRPSKDTSTPLYAIDVVLAGRTFVLVPQPAEQEQLNAWVRTWMGVVGPDIIAPELLSGRYSRAAPASATGAATGASSAQSRFAVPSVSVHPASGAASGGVPPLICGYLQKLPVTSKSRQSKEKVKALFNNVAGWKRRFLVLRPGLLQWYREDPNQDGEFLGTLRLTSTTTVELETHKGGERRLRVHAAGETLVLRDDSDGMVPVTEWEQALVSHVFTLRDGAGDATGSGGGGGGPLPISPRQSPRGGAAPMDVS